VTRTIGPYGELKVIDLDSGQVRQLTRDDALAQSPAWSADSLHIYFASSRSGTMNIWKIPARGGEAEQITAGQGDDAQPDVSSDGRRIVFSTYRETISIARLDLTAEAGSPGPEKLTVDPARSVFAPVYSPDGARLAYFSNFKGVENEGIWVAGADGSDPLALALDARVNVFPRWSPDSQSLIYRSGPTVPTAAAEYRRVSVSGGAPETILGDITDINPDVGRDGRVLFRDPRGQIQSYDPSSRQMQALSVSGPSEKGWLLRWSSDERSVAYLVQPKSESDPDAGLWMDELEGPPSQLFHGWVNYYAPGPGDEVYFLEGRPDLNEVVWRVGWNGQGLTRLGTVREYYNYWNPPGAARPAVFFDVSPDSRHLAFSTQEVLQANIGMLESVR
jgi:Tol biopolymer transport system component